MTPAKSDHSGMYSAQPNSQQDRSRFDVWEQSIGTQKALYSIHSIPSPPQVGDKLLSKERQDRTRGVMLKPVAIRSGAKCTRVPTAISAMGGPGIEGSPDPCLYT